MLTFDCRFDDGVTFHIIFQGQYLPPGFCWETIARYYAKQGSKRSVQNEEEPPSKRSKVDEESETE